MDNDKGQKTFCLLPFAGSKDKKRAEALGFSPYSLGSAAFSRTQLIGDFTRGNFPERNHNVLIDGAVLDKRLCPLVKLLDSFCREHNQ
jgi:hypothetical protein